ncbi:MAG: hypothetical protein U0289_00055 [Cyclobacteriaceae bacterium]
MQIATNSIHGVRWVDNNATLSQYFCDLPHLAGFWILRMNNDALGLHTGTTLQN